MLFLCAAIAYPNKKFSTSTPALYWVFSIPLILFTSMRPWGIMRDDRAYLNIFGNIDATHFNNGFIAARDALWFLLIMVIKGFYNSPDIILLTAGLILFFKLFLIQKLSNRKNQLLMLFVYVCAFWQIHDLTQFRASLAILFFLCFLNYSCNLKVYQGKLSLILSFLSHNSAVASLIFVVEHYLWQINPTKKKASAKSSCLAGSTASNVDDFTRASLYSKIIPHIISPNKAIGISAFFLLLIQLDLYPKLGALIGYLTGASNELTQASTSQLDMYYERSIDGNYSNYRTLPIILIVVVTCYWVILKEKKLDAANILNQLATRSLIIATSLSWLFASISDVQVRYYEFFLVGCLFFISRINSNRSFIAASFIGFAYYAKLNIFWNIWST